MYRSYQNIGDAEEPGKDQYSTISIEDETEKNTLIEQNRILCVEVYADWCQPCKQISPDYSMMAAEYIKKGAMLVKENYEKKLSFQIQGLPTFCFYKDGKEIPEIRVIGADLNEVQKTLDALLKANESQMRGPPTGKNAVRLKAPNFSGNAPSYGSY